MWLKNLKTVFIVNPKSGTPKFPIRLHLLIRKYYGESNPNVHVWESKYAGNVRELAEKAVQEGFHIVVAVGGDGTVNEAAQAVVNSPAALGVIPTGSGNGFARNMDIPLRMEKAVATVHSPTFKQIDVGKLNDKYFLVSCGFGWESVIATLFEGSKIRGPLPYAGVALQSFIQYEPQEIIISAQPEDWQYKGRPMLFSVTNMRQYGLGVTIAPDADYQDGKLDICLLPRHSVLDAIKYMPDMLRQRTDQVPGYIHQMADIVNVTRPTPGNIHLDGTPALGGLEFTIQVVPKALSVVVHKKDKNKKSFNPFQMITGN